MRVLALDLSLTATGFVCLDREPGPDALGPMTSKDSGGHGVIKTPARKKGQSDWEWNRDRFVAFRDVLLTIIQSFRPDTIIVEVSQRAMMYDPDNPRYSAGAQYRAGQGLGRAMGWLDATMLTAGLTYAMVSSDVATAKKAITGKGTASKDAVHDFLERIYGWNLRDWDPNAVDALSLALAHLQITWQTERDTRLGLSATSSVASLTKPSPSPQKRSTGTASGKRSPASSRRSKRLGTTIRPTRR